jgi:hypothetical protein
MGAVRAASASSSAAPSSLAQDGGGVVAVEERPEGAVDADRGAGLDPVIEHQPAVAGEDRRRAAADLHRPRSSPCARADRAIERAASGARRRLGEVDRRAACKGAVRRIGEIDVAERAGERHEAPADLALEQEHVLVLVIEDDPLER